jgi:L1 cell adhesion molecule like protein
MVNDAEQYRDEDERARERVNARNHLETYLYSCKQAVENYNGSAITDSEKSSVINACEEMQRWLDSNQLAEKEEIEHQYAQLDKRCRSVMVKMHGGGGGGGANTNGKQYNRSGSQGGGHSGPRVEEVD